MKTLVVCSGGLDSVSLAQKVAAQHSLAGLLSFDYGQRHRKEVGFAALCAERLSTRTRSSTSAQSAAAFPARR